MKYSITVDLVAANGDPVFRHTVHLTRPQALEIAAALREWADDVDRDAPERDDAPPARPEVTKP